MKNALFALLGFILLNCSGDIKQFPELSSQKSKGSLFIIGGGSRGETMINRMIDEAGLRSGGYAYILPMASELADSAIFWSSEQFWKAGLSNVSGFNFSTGSQMTDSRMDSIRNANLIFVSGGDQRRFMQIVRNSPIEDAMKQAYQSGALIAGTSAGAAIMSKLMITGTELRHPEYNSTFRQLELGNIELDTGMAFLDGIIIDQHFIRRSRYNRLITALAEYPEMLGIGIEESTAILVKNDSAEVVGESQVITFVNKGGTLPGENYKFGMRNLVLNIFLPGEKFYLKAND